MCPTSRHWKSGLHGGAPDWEDPAPNPFLLQKTPGHRAGFTWFSSTRKGCSEFFPFLCHCFTHSQKHGLISLASSMKPLSPHPWGQSPSLSSFLWLTCHVGLSTNYSVHHYLGSPFEIRKHNFHFSALHTQRDLKQHLRTNCKNCRALSTLNLTTKHHIHSSGETQPTSQMRKTEAHRSEVVTPTIIVNK